MLQNENQIIERIQAGEDGLFDLLVGEYQDRLASFVLRTLGDRDGARDVCQESFLKAWKAIGRFRGEARFSTWLFTIARREALHHRRRAGRRQEEDWEPHQDPPAERGNAGDPVARARLAECLARLPEVQRAALHLHYLEARDVAEIAAILGRAEGTVKSDLARGRETLRKILEDETQGARHVPA